jgi:hypothetical protein
MMPCKHSPSCVVSSNEGTQYCGACADLDYIAKMLRQAVDFAEAEGDFKPVRRWINELEKTINEPPTTRAAPDLC